MAHYLSKPERKLFLAFFLIGFYSISASAQDLKRAGWLGARMLELNDSLVKVHKLPGKSGLLVQEVLANSTAAALKVAAKDVLLAVNGKPLNKLTDLNPALGKWYAGDPVQLTIQRGKKKLELKGKAAGKAIETSSVAD